jgi:diphosphomevalonate decarboxylase
MKATATAPSNLALMKYMGRKDDVLRLPANGSVAMNLSGCQTTTTIEFSPDYPSDSLRIDGQEEGGAMALQPTQIRKSMFGTLVMMGDPPVDEVWTEDFWRKGKP